MINQYKMKIRIIMCFNFQWYQISNNLHSENTIYVIKIKFELITKILSLENKGFLSTLLNLN